MADTISGFSTIGVTLSTSPTTNIGTINAAAGPAIYGGAATDWTFNNQGLLETQSGDGGINLQGQGSVFNAAGGVIRAYGYGIRLGQAGTIVNAGQIISQNDYGNDITLPSGQLTNAVGGLISGGRTAIAFGPGTTILNQGTILSTNGYGLTVYGSGGLITNAAGATIAGQFASVELANDDTLVNAGLITTKNPGAGTPIVFGDNAGIGTGTNNLLVLDPGSTIQGQIAGFIAGDTIDLAGEVISGETFSNGVLTLSNGAATVATLALTRDLNTGEFVLSTDHAGGTEITLGTDIVSSTYGSGFDLSALNTTFLASATIDSGFVGLTGSGAQAWNVVNDGAIEDPGQFPNNFGVLLNNFGTFRNDASGLIIGGTGVALRGQGGTFINAGTVISSGGPDGVSIQFSAGAAYRPDHPGYGARYVNPAQNITLILEPGSRLGGAIGGFDTGNTIDVAGIVATREHFSNGVLTLSNHGSAVSLLALQGNFNDAEIGIASDGHGGTDITLASKEVIRGDYTAGIQLSAPYTDITSTARVSGGPVFSEQGRYVTVANAGKLSSSGSLGVGIDLQAGRLTNSRAGTISGGHYGVEMFYGTMVNAGYLISTGNMLGATGFQGAGGAVLINTGTVIGFTGATVFGASIDNKAAGEIIGAVGVDMYQGTLLNAGTIASTAGAAGVAVTLGSNSTLIVDPGAVFVGAVSANGAANDVLELSGKSSVPLAGIGSAFSGFATIAFADNARWDIAGSSAGLADNQQITGFKAGDAITLTDAAASTGSVTVATDGVVTIDAGGTAYTLRIAGAYASEKGFVFSNFSLTEHQPKFMSQAEPLPGGGGIGAALRPLDLADFLAVPGAGSPSGFPAGPSAATLSSAGTEGAVLGGITHQAMLLARDIPAFVSLATHGFTAS